MWNAIIESVQSGLMASIGLAAGGFIFNGVVIYQLIKIRKVLDEFKKEKKKE